LRFDASGSDAALLRLLVLVLSVLGVIGAAWAAQALLIRGYKGEARSIRPGGRVLLVGRTFHAAHGATRVAIVLEGGEVEMLALPDGRWSERVSIAAIDALAVTDTDSVLEWATSVSIAVAGGADWEVQLEGWRVLPKFFLRRRANMALAELESRITRSRARLDGSRANPAPPSSAGCGPSEGELGSFEHLGLDAPAGDPADGAGARPRWRWIFWAMGVVVVYATSMAVLVSYVVAFQHLRDLSGWPELVRLWLWPFFDLANVSSGLVRASVAVATRDESFAATVSMVPTFFLAFGVGLVRGALIVGIASLGEVVVRKLVRSLAHGR
jgi:hypothetical protein